MPHYRMWVVVYWGFLSHKQFIQQNVLSTYYVLSSILGPIDTMNKSGKIAASWTYIIVGGRGQTFNNLNK